ncbi:type IV pilus, mannose-sensitive hemagglutinin protein MshF [Aliivibrio fischeri]|uniref:type IV pilus, mannose-sensitive hemagglutinin protein MshF n=1 Tax=Aliivibrio fischeri TaxID=668 RepID=UPI0012D9B564|nr:type IV pilus, mannose-sensitive hemagglutinin protein MshF [Aliivibrio fischeri]MUK30627.1 type IV pilus, mannose-sensitive hemagglutinin protein MshF [Aliivibrio fischeri]MUK67077.1 type IV pilus, mannose-sensitive hemagglutinin protein MshF [Aliivibrio fischeri]
MSATRILWGALVIILLAVIFINWEKIEPEVEDTAIIMTSREILSSANEFKNYWVVNGQPKTMVKDDIEVSFSSLGWPIVLKENDEIDCLQWLHLLLPNKDKIYADSIEIKKPELAKKEQYRCDYSTANGKVVSVMLVKDALKVSVGFIEKK